jgi:hypothetical protein
MTADRRVAPEDAAGAGDAVVAQPPRDDLWRAPGGELGEDAPHDSGLIRVDRPPAALLARRDVVADARAVAAAPGPMRPSMPRRVVGEVLETEAASRERRQWRHDWVP